MRHSYEMVQRRKSSGAHVDAVSYYLDNHHKFPNAETEVILL